MPPGTTPQGRTPDGRKVQVGLSNAAKLWPTPRASPNENRNTRPAPSHGKTHGRTLAGDAVSWPTPRATDGSNGGPNQTGGALTPAATNQQWPTPGANDHKGSAKPGQRRGQLDETAEQGSVNGHPLPATWLDGPESSQSGPTSRRRLNPRFVEWLMGWPEGTVYLAQSSSASSVTE